MNPIANQNKIETYTKRKKSGTKDYKEIQK